MKNKKYFSEVNFEPKAPMTSQGKLLTKPNIACVAFVKGLPWLVNRIMFLNKFEYLFIAIRIACIVCKNILCDESSRG